MSPSTKYTAWILTFSMLVLWASGAIAGVEREVPPEDALWVAAGEAFENGEDKSSAIMQYRLFVESYKKSDRSAHAQFMLAECYFSIGDYEQAIREYGRVEKFKGRDEYLEASVLLRVGECQFNSGNFDEAIERFNRLIKKHDDTFLLAEGLYEVGLAYIVDGNWMKLQAAYQDLLETRPGYLDLPQVKFALGIFAYHDQRFEEAIAYFEQVSSDRGLFYLGKSLEDTGQYILAIQRYKQMLREYPDSPLSDDASFSIAESFYRSGQNSVAVRSYRAFIDGYPQSPFIPNARYKMACVTFREGRYDESIRQLEEVCQAFAGEMVCAYARYLVGDCYMQLGASAEAIFAWTDVVRDFGESRVASAALHKIVYAYAVERNFGQSILMAEDFLRRFSGDQLEPRVQLLRGFSHFQLEEYEPAVLAFQNVLDKNVNTEVGERALFLCTLAYDAQGQQDRLLTNYNYIAARLLPTPSHWRARSYYNLGEAYYAQGLFRKSGEMYRLVLTGYPRSNVAASSLQGLVASLSQMGEYELALQEQEEFLLALSNADSEEGTNSLAVGSIYFNRRDYEGALAQFNEYLEKHPNDPGAASALLNQGDALYRLQYYEQSLESWQALLNRFPESEHCEEARYRIADTYFGLGRFGDARSAYLNLQTAHPKGSHRADAAFGVANTSYNMGEDDTAIAAFTSFIETYPNDERVEDAELGIQSCYYRGGKDMEEYLARRPDSPLAADVYWNKGQEAFADEDFRSAAKAFERVTLDYPGSESGPGALFYLAESYYRLEDMEPALAGYRNFVTTHPSHDLAELAHLRKATVLFKLERYRAAAEAYERQNDLYPEGEYAALAIYNQAICYQEVEDWNAAVSSYRSFLDRFPTHENAQGLWLQIAALYQEELGDWGAAVEAYEEAGTMGEANLSEVRFRQGECHEKAGDAEAALASYSGAAAGGGTDPFRIAALAQMGEMLETRGEFEGAISAYQRIVDANGKLEWTDMAQARIAAIREKMVAGR